MSCSQGLCSLFKPHIVFLVFNSHISRTEQSKFKPRLVASTELHKNEHTYQVWPSKPILKDKHPQKLPEEPIQVVVSILIVLAGLCNVKHSDFSPRILTT